MAINPKNRAHWDTVQGLKRNELVTVFAGAFKDTSADRKYDEGISLLVSLMEGGRGKAPAGLLKGSFVQRKAPAPAAPAPAKAEEGEGPPRQGSPPRRPRHRGCSARRGAPAPLSPRPRRRQRGQRPSA